MVVIDDLPQIPAELLARAARWAELKRWERRELGQTLRRFGLSYNEIAAIIPVHDGTLSGWCRDIELSVEQLARLHAKRPALEVRRAVGKVLRQAAIDRHESIRHAARLAAIQLAKDPLFTAGLAAYWSEGSKTRDVCFSNSDPHLVLLFLRWAQTFLSADPSRFGVRMHLHDGQDEDERKDFWSHLTGIPIERFGKTFVKREGNGPQEECALPWHGSGAIEQEPKRS